ncbi:MAG TPA: hypothetical protein VFP84_22465 [Kofleriaceae bacterium]|nr:hypothetical protein [Kofleriaceae bacterium]
MRSIRNDFILAGVLIAGAALVFFLVIDTARASASQPHQPGGGGYVLFYTPLSLAVRHLIRAVRRLRSPT